MFQNFSLSESSWLTPDLSSGFSWIEELIRGYSWHLPLDYLIHEDQAVHAAMFFPVKILQEPVAFLWHSPLYVIYYHLLWIVQPVSELVLFYQYLVSDRDPINGGARWLSGRVSDSGARGRGFETYRRRVVSLSKTLYSPKVLVNYPGSGGSFPLPDMTEKLLTGTLSLNTNKQNPYKWAIVHNWPH